MVLLWWISIGTLMKSPSKQDRMLPRAGLMLLVLSWIGFLFMEARNPSGAGPSGPPDTPATTARGRLDNEASKAGRTLHRNEVVRRVRMTDGVELELALD
jgi:hypothetical protein